MLALTVKKSSCNAGDWVQFLGWKDLLKKGNGKPFQYFCLGNPMDRGAWQATVHGVKVRHNLATKPPPLAQKQKHRSMEQDKKPRNRSTNLWSINL